MNSQSNSLRHRAWPHALLESAVLSSALLLASTAAMATPAPAAAAAATTQPAAGDDVVKGLHQASTYTITSPPIGPLMMDKPKLPDLSGYTQQAMQKKIVRSKAGKVSIRRMMQEDSLKEFIGGDNKMAEWVARQHGIPQAIFIDDGYMTLQELAKKVPKQYLSETSPGVYLARLPIVVGKKGIFEIDKKTSELRLSQDAGAFLVNDTQLFIADTRLTGWREKANAPSTFKTPKEFRPFLLSWGGTQTYMFNTKVASLGYNNSKSYGLSISQYTPNMKAQMNRPDPTGWIVNSEFSDMWYGYY